MKKKMILFAAGIAAALLMTGCGKKTAEAPELQDETAAPEISDSTPDLDENGDESQELGEDNSLGEAVTAPVKIWGTITGVEENSIAVDNQSENSSTGEIILHVDMSQNRVIDAVTGYPAALEDIELGRFEAYLGEAMTMSLPPQNNPYLVIVNIPEEESQAPQYAVAAGALQEEDDAYVLTATDGRTYQVPKDVEVLPFLTRNIVKLEDISQGTECLIWLDGEDKAEKIVLFAE